MAKLIVMRDQAGATGDDITEIENGKTATDVLMRYFPDGLDPESVQIFLNKDKLTLPSESEQSSVELLQPLKDDDILFVVLEVKGVEAVIIWAIIAAVAVSVLMPKPEIPGDAGSTKQSPNNTLQAQTNIARPYQAYPLIFGSPVSYPDLTGEANIEYVNNTKYVKQLMNIGVGLFDITNIRSGQTPLSNFSGSSATYYEPVNNVVTVPNVIESFSVNEIDGQEVEGVDDTVIVNSYSLTPDYTDPIQYIANTFTFHVIKDTDSDTLKNDYDNSTSDLALNIDYITDPNGAGFAVDVSGTGDIGSMVLDGGGTYYTVELTTFNGPRAMSAIGYDFDSPFYAATVAASVIGPINVGKFTDELWFNIIFKRGLKSTVKFKVTLVELDGPNGNPIVGPQLQPDLLFEYTEDTLEEQFRTYKAVLVHEGYYSFSMSRLDVSTDDSAEPDTTTLEAVYAINRYTDVEYGNVTLVDVTVPATVNATSLRENKINLALTSKLITYDVDTSTVITTPTASRKFADALLHMYVEFFGLDANTLALDELYEIQDRLDLIDPRLATFDFTFDDIDVSLDERMDSILQVARCYKWLDGDVYRFGRNEEREFETTTITRRDLASDDDRDYSLSYNPQLTENYDSVKIEYIDASINKKAYIYRKIDGSGDVVSGSGFNPKSLQLAGCSEQYNAINRAELEMRTLMYQRWILTDTMLSNGMLLDRGDMVLYAEQYNNGGDLFDGEITAVNGNIATISESIDLTDGNTYQVHYTIEDGSSVGPFTITAVDGNPFQFECTSLTQAYVRDSILGFLIQTGSRYIISTTEELDASRWTVTEKEPQGKNVQITLVNYDAAIYAYD